jgi:hypothetical protein
MKERRHGRPGSQTGWQSLFAAGGYVNCKEEVLNEFQYK